MQSTIRVMYLKSPGAENEFLDVELINFKLAYKSFITINIFSRKVLEDTLKKEEPIPIQPVPAQVVQQPIQIQQFQSPQQVQSSSIKPISDTLISPSNGTIIPPFPSAPTIEDFDFTFTPFIYEQEGFLYVFWHSHPLYDFSFKVKDDHVQVKLLIMAPDPLALAEIGLKVSVKTPNITLNFAYYFEKEIYHRNSIRINHEKFKGIRVEVNSDSNDFKQL